MKKYLAVAGIVAVALGSSSAFTGQLGKEAQIEYILQGANKATIVDNVGNVGGTVVHEYSIIEAVSVKLSMSQLTEIKKLNPMLRSFKGQQVNVSSVIESFDSDNISFNVRNNTATWKGVNNSNNSVVIDSIAFNMPSANKQIRSIKINGNRINARKIDPNSTITLLESEQFLLGPGESIEIETKFAQLESVSASEYNISFNEHFHEPSYTPTVYTTDSVMVAGKLGFDVANNQINWKVANTVDYAREVSEFEIAYPILNAAIQSITVNNRNVSYVINAKNEVLLDEPVGVLINEPVKISITFDSLSSINIDDYELEVDYSDGLSEEVVLPAIINVDADKRDTNFPSLVRANVAHQQGITGAGVTVAILDTGMRFLDEIKYKSNGFDRKIDIIDVLGTSKNRGRAQQNDYNGHGTHLASLISNSSKSVDANGNFTGGYNGIAPDANLVVMKAFDEEGHSSYGAILAAIDYVVENKDVHNIRVLNLSFSAIPSSYYWDDPLNQALMKAWDAGITVVAAAGNRGPQAMTIGVPGNTPYVITVGAVSDNYTPSNLNDDFVTTFSSAGPTYEGFIKPEVVAPGGHIQGVMASDTLIRETYALYNDSNMDEHDYFELSGSSQSTAITSGIVALMLQANPNLSPDDIKCRLIETAKAATTETGELAFSIFQQGAGLVDAMAAIESTEMGCSNGGLSIAKDMSGEEHFIGPARRHENDGDFYIPGVDGLEWSGIYSDSQLWRNMSFNSDSQLWRNMSFNSDSQIFDQTNFTSNSQLWRNMSFNADSQLWRNMSFNADSQLWRNMTFNADSQLWRNMTFNADSQQLDIMSFESNSIAREWVNHE